MSGGSGSGGGFVPSKPIQPGGGKDPCNIAITLPLSAVDPQQVKLINVDDLLPVEQRSTNETTTVVVVNPKSNNAVVGAVAYADIEALLDCLEEGNEYTAKVLRKSATSVNVKIFRK